jgi:hypothetical protein
MSDFNPINNVKPAYPIKPVQPSRKDRESDGRQTDHQTDQKDVDESEGKDDDPTLIDEYV